MTDTEAQTLTRQQQAEQEAVRRHSSRLIEDYEEDRYEEDEWGYDSTARAAFVEGVTWADENRPPSTAEISDGMVVRMLKEAVARIESIGDAGQAGPWVHRVGEHELAGKRIDYGQHWRTLVAVETTIKALRQHGALEALLRLPEEDEAAKTSALIAEARGFAGDSDSARSTLIRDLAAALEREVSR